MSHRSRTRRRCEQPESSRGSALQPRASGALQPHRDASPSARARRARAHPSPSLPRTTDSAAVTLLEQRELLTQACCAPRTAGVARGKKKGNLARCMDQYGQSFGMYGTFRERVGVMGRLIPHMKAL